MYLLYTRAWRPPSPPSDLCSNVTFSITTLNITTLALALPPHLSRPPLLSPKALNRLLAQHVPASYKDVSAEMGSEHLGSSVLWHLYIL